MNRIQKQSWIIIVSTGCAFLFSCLVVTYWAFTLGFPAALNGFMFTTLGAFGYLGFFFVKQDNPEIIDERDSAIRAEASKNALIMSYLFLVVLLLGMWYFKEPQDVVKVETLFLGVCLSFALSAVTEALTIVIEYGKDAKATEGETA